MNPYQFFLEHGGSSYNPATETARQGRVRGARQLAEVERRARDGGYSYRWSIDGGASSGDWVEPWHVWQCAMYNVDSQIVASLHGIDFGRHGEPWGDPYRRVVEAELAIDGLTNQPQGAGS